MTGSPAMFLPRISGSDMFWSSNAWLPTSSDRLTVSRFGLGSSMPITLRPGMVATRADSADMLRAMSSASWITRLALIPLAGSSSYMVTTGPGRTSTMSPRTWKSSSTLSSRRALRSSPARSIWRFGLSGGAASRSSVGSCVIVAQREARLAGQRARLAASGAALAAATIGRAGSATATAGRDRGGAAAPSSRRGNSSRCGAARRGGWRRGGAVGRPVASLRAEGRGRTSRATSPPSASSASSVSRSGPSIDGIADQRRARQSTP